MVSLVAIHRIPRHANRRCRNVPIPATAAGISVPRLSQGSVNYDVSGNQLFGNEEHIMPEIPRDRFVVNDLMAFSAEELADHCGKLAKEIRDGEYEDDGSYSLQVILGHLMDHVVDIWHLSKMNDAEYEAETQAEYQARCLIIPKLQDGYVLVDPEYKVSRLNASAHNENTEQDDARSIPPAAPRLPE